MLDDCVPDLQIAPARMRCPRRTRFNAATKTCDSMSAVPCDAKGNMPKPNVAAGGSSSSGVESGIAKSEFGNSKTLFRHFAHCTQSSMVCCFVVFSLS